ncbi:FGGY-family carbohydrate kinase [Anaerobaca lacustris]|uniref:FGGY family carbohydrate kinase n=1 Tax=Anaerobaca lacustris TaxID=3044600 RepID=A0AAW6U0K6_9BACT|nr:FGGY family carbohydrate kinase [Sedimentisphaerales bacterium M17dextr]
MSVIGLDIGTTGCKAAVFNDQWEILARAAREYSVLTPCPHWAEQDAELVWQLALEVLAQVATESRADPPKAIALSVQGEAVIAVDGAGHPMRHAILGMDTRTTAESDWLAETFGAEALFRRTGMPMHTMNTVTKLLWLQRNEPQLWGRAAQFLLYEDYFLRRLTGRAVISHCLASRTQMYDLETSAWATDILDRCQIDPDRLAELLPPDEAVVGTLDETVARTVGLSGSILVATGGHDQACAALGSGVTRPGRAMVSTGTAEVVEVAMASPVLAPNLREGNISVYRHVVPGLYLAMTLNHSGGLALRWFRDTLCRDRIAEAAQTGRDAYDLLLAGAPKAPTDLLVLPHFAGAGTPLLDTHSKGAIIGLTFATTQAEIAKAILEGLTFELRVNLELLRQAGIAFDELHAVGGGARSKLWLQLKADICRQRLRVPRVTEAACLGAAMLAAVATGDYPDVPAAASAAVRLDAIIEPDPQRTGEYDRRYETYRRLYPAMKDIYEAQST